MAAQGYYVPHGSHWPIVGSVGVFTMLVGFALLLNGMSNGMMMMVGLGILLLMMFGWFGTVVRESERGYYKEKEDASFRWGMGWFIFSEVMFFAAFFGALFYARMYSVPWLAGEETTRFFTHDLLWPSFEADWPTNGPAHVGGHFESMSPWGLPALNTLILLSSGVTVTWAHWGLIDNNRKQLILGLAATVGLGFLFVALQAFEYMHAMHEMNLTLSSGIYGSTFYMLTGFHGFHVTMGAIMLLIIMFRSMAGHFSPQRHFAFEAVAWYWHFVDVVWLGLFIFVYWF